MSRVLRSRSGSRERSRRRFSSMVPRFYPGRPAPPAPQDLSVARLSGAGTSAGSPSRQGRSCGGITSQQVNSSMKRLVESASNESQLGASRSRNRFSSFSVSLAAVHGSRVTGSSARGSWLSCCDRSTCSFTTRARRPAAIAPTPCSFPARAGRPDSMAFSDSASPPSSPRYLFLFSCSFSLARACGSSQEITFASRRRGGPGSRHMAWAGGAAKPIGTSRARAGSRCFLMESSPMILRLRRRNRQGGHLQDQGRVSHASPLLSRLSRPQEKSRQDPGFLRPDPGEAPLSGEIATPEPSDSRRWRNLPPLRRDSRQNEEELRRHARISRHDKRYRDIIRRHCREMDRSCADGEGVATKDREPVATSREVATLER